MQAADGRQVGVSADKLTWTFTLRDGLEWHDGKPVTSEDCVASLKRWGAKDSMGQKLMGFVTALEARRRQDLQDRAEGALRPGARFARQAVRPTPFMMPKRVAETDPNKQIDDYIGSGPFIFKKDEWKPGEKTVYVKNPNYKPRAEPPSGLAGGKVAKVDRVEWIAIPDQQTAVNALLAGEIDMIEEPPHDLLPLLKADKNVKLETLNQCGRPVHLPLQPALQAVRQCQDPPGGALRLRAEGLPRRHDRRSRVLQGLQGGVHLRHAARHDDGLRRQVQRSPRPRSC